jgi:hypothetical protein
VSVVFISAPSMKCYSGGNIKLQQMPPGSHVPFCNNFLISSLEDKDIFNGGGGGGAC